MGYTNLKENLQRKFADWLGEHQDLEKHIAEVTAAYESLGEKRDRLETVEKLLTSTKIIMKEIAPNWKSESVRPSRRNAMKLPFNPGEVTRMAFDVMRREARPMSSRMIAALVVAEKGLDPDDRMLVDQVKIAVDASLRSKKGQFVETDGEGYGRTWFIIQGDRPTPSDQ
ncbi:MAG: hypothetical protein ACK4ZW_04755 [Blastomonas sp.]